jgi:hypothetical protein
MLLLLHTAHKTIMEQHWPHPNLGRLVSPREFSRIDDTAAAGLPWAADNDAYLAWDAGRFRSMLAAIRGLPGCLFVAAPDVVGDWDETLRRFGEWMPELVECGQPIAIVLQDGCRAVPDLPEVAAVFVGGTTEWKLSETARKLVADAQDRGLWTHMGRVNTRRRIRLALAWGIDSIDGTQWSRWRHTHLGWGLECVGAAVQGLLGEDR